MGKECDRLRMGIGGGFQLTRLDGGRWMVRNGISGRTFVVELPEGEADGRGVRILRHLMPRLAFLYEARRPDGEVLDVRRAEMAPATMNTGPIAHCLCTLYTCASSPGMGTTYEFHDERLVAVRRTGWANDAAGAGGSLYEKLELRTLQVIFGMLSTLASRDGLDM